MCPVRMSWLGMSFPGIGLDCPASSQRQLVSKAGDKTSQAGH